MLRITVVVGGCFIAGSAQLLRPATYTTYHRQTDGAGSQSGVWGAEGAGWLVRIEVAAFVPRYVWMVTHPSGASRFHVLTLKPTRTRPPHTRKHVHEHC